MARAGAPALDCDVKVDCKEGEVYCGKCCRRAFVPLLRSDVEKLTERLRDVSRYVEWVSGVPALRKTESRACVFLDTGSGRCTIYDVRPLACRLYPLVHTLGLWCTRTPPAPSQVL